MKNVLAIALLFVTSTAAAEKSASSAFRSHYLFVGTITGWDLSGNNLQTAADAGAEHLKNQPRDNDSLVKRFCDTFGDALLREEAALSAAIKTNPKAIAILQSSNYHTLIAYPKTLCGLKIDLKNVSSEDRTVLRQVKGDFAKYYQEVKKDRYLKKLAKYSDAMTTALN
jgi:hypothetical protein